MSDDTVLEAGSPAAPSLLDEPVGDDGLADLLATRRSRRGLPKVTVALVGAALVAAGFIGGVQVEKAQGSTSGGGGGRAAAGAGAAGTGASAGTGRNFRSFLGGTGGGAGGAAGGAVSGTVKLIQGNTIYVEESNGDIATVTTSGTTTVRVSSTSTLSSLTPGTTVTVLGSAGTDGSVAATSITASGATSATNQ